MRRIPSSVAPHSMRTPTERDDACLRVATHNMNGLNSNSMSQKLIGVTGLMDAHRLHLLAVQETRLYTATDAAELLVYTDYSPLQHPAQEHNDMPSGGCGVQVGSTIASSVTWLGVNSSHRYASAWCKISNFEGGKPLKLSLYTLSLIHI